MLKIRKKIYWTWRKFLLRFFPCRAVDRDWEKWKGYPVDWKRPRDLNEKIQWLMFRGDTSLWTLCADKYRVREYVSSKGLGDILVPLLGVWEKAEDVPFESLPEKFAIKCNHDSGSTHIVDKSAPGYDPEAIRKDLSKHLKVKYGYVHGEMFYNAIPPRIIAEQLLEPSDGRASMTDYKIWCFGGKPYAIMTCAERTKDGFLINVFDPGWNERKDVCVYSAHYRRSETPLPRPESLERMLSAAEKLSEGFPEVRVDFYEEGGKLYFGELTFASLCGKMTYFTDAFLRELGEQCILPGGTATTLVGTYFFALSRGERNFVNSKLHIKDSSACGKKGRPTVFVYPRSGEINPYIANLTKSLEPYYNPLKPGLVKNGLPPIFGLLRAAFRADVVVLNWLENVAFNKFPLIQTFLALLSVTLIKAREKKIVWIFHNLRPHKGVNKKTSLLTSLQFRKADLIIAHSKEAADFAQKRAGCEVLFRCHPVSRIAYQTVADTPQVDVLYWGNIYKYKGVDKFVEFLHARNTGLRVHIMGQCKSKELSEAIRSNCDELITFDNTQESFDLIASYVSRSKFVVFPYVGESISSSGALIDTIVLGGNVVGPSRGAFIDLEEKGLCHTYRTYEEMLQILMSDAPVDKTAVSSFIEENKWSDFGSFIFTHLGTI